MVNVVDFGNSSFFSTCLIACKRKQGQNVNECYIATCNPLEFLCLERSPWPCANLMGQDRVPQKMPQICANSWLRTHRCHCSSPSQIWKGVRQKESGKRVTRKVTEASEKWAKVQNGKHSFVAPWVFVFMVVILLINLWFILVDVHCRLRKSRFQLYMPSLEQAARAARQHEPL